ncbi:hypothetical protein [Chryseobacterium chendengshani]|uniref:hypothetical protein n=1 Tax=Chryseobacterium sp. LJ756 TaxID=2864113 RepID=UPI001C63C478|nr:hypothetical protein [Chryseobacterium sp. LJ756]MBW7675637.1 hypothetical protein [Chryseobacterium sp. LJ756]
MKKILGIFSMMLIFLIGSCKEEEEMYYDGDSLLHFTKGTSDNAFVLSGTGSSVYKLSYGITKAASSDSEVKLVFDQAKSTAQLGVDFQIVNATNVIPAGQTFSTFDIKILEASATPTPKTAVFRVVSGNLPGANFNNEFKLNMSLSCPASTFVGLFQVKNTLFGTYDVEIIEGTAANTLVLKDYIEVGYDITLTYDPNTGVITFPTQETGYINGANGMIMIKQAIDGSSAKVDFCNRTMDLRLSYGTPGGATYTSGGATSYTDVFTGK